METCDYQKILPNKLFEKPVSYRDTYVKMDLCISNRFRNQMVEAITGLVLEPWLKIRPFHFTEPVWFLDVDCTSTLYLKF
jgi:hypothetical protein